MTTTYRLLVCGSRTFSDVEFMYDKLEAWLDNFEADPPVEGDVDLVVVHGGAKGADSLADDWAHAQGITREEYPADWHGQGRSAGIRRNQVMLDSGIDHCLAFVDKPLASSRGTADMVTRCKAAGVHGCVYSRIPVPVDSLAAQL